MTFEKLDILLLSTNRNRMTIIEKIVRNHRKTQAAIALEMNISPKCLYNYMKEPKKMQLHDLEKLANALDRSPRNLYSLIITNKPA